MSKQLKQAVTLFKSFRERAPTKLARLAVSIPKVAACMGHVEAIDYRTTHGRKVTLYHHDFAPGSRPLLCVSANGRQLLLLGGHYQWDERGIVDKDKAGRSIVNPKHGRRMNPKRETKAALYRRTTSEVAAARKLAKAAAVYTKAVGRRPR